MGLVVCPDAECAAMRMADIIAAAVRQKPDLTLGLATGRTAGMAFAELVKRHHTTDDLSFRRVRTFNTDEFVGISPDAPQSARYFMNANLFCQADFKRENTYVPYGTAVDLDQECKAYEALLLARGGMDLVVLGLGHNGHVSFNEPGSSAKSRTRVVDFTESTIAGLSNGYRFSSVADTPTQAISMGMGTILAARQIVLIATGIAKAQAVHRMFDIRPGPSVPASLLTQHPGLTVIVDPAAASQLKSTTTDLIR